MKEEQMSRRTRLFIAMITGIAIGLAPAAQAGVGGCEPLGYCQAVFDRCWEASKTEFASCYRSCILFPSPLVRNAACLDVYLRCDECFDRPDPLDPFPENCPVLIDLDRNNFHLTGVQDGVLFDIDADGAVNAVSWTHPDHRDAFLCLDRNTNDLIDDGSELFGNSTPLLLNLGFTAPNGYVALAEFDMPSLGGNADGYIDREDAIYEELCAWTDSNQNGISEPDAVSTLPAAGVERIGLLHQSSGRTDQHGNRFWYSGDA
jgi:hypothetical protein